MVYQHIDSKGFIINNVDGILTISGKPSANITSSSEIGYTVETTNSGCTAKSYSGIISIAPKPVLLLIVVQIHKRYVKVKH